MNKYGLEEKDMKNLCVAHGGACKITLNLFTLKDGKIGFELVGSKRLIIEEEPAAEEKEEEKKEKEGNEEPEEGDY